MADNTQKSSKKWLWWALGIAALILIIIWMSNLSGGSDTTNDSTGSEKNSPTTETPAGEVTISALAQDPTQYDGQSIAVDGEVSELYGEHTALITEVGAVGGQGVFLISPRELSVSTGDQVMIQGTVHTGIVKDILEQLGIDASRVENLIGDHAVIEASSITPLTGSENSQTATSSQP